MESRLTHLKNRLDSLRDIEAIIKLTVRPVKTTRMVCGDMKTYLAAHEEVRASNDFYDPSIPIQYVITTLADQKNNYEILDPITILRVQQYYPRHMGTQLSINQVNFDRNDFDRKELIKEVRACIYTLDPMAYKAFYN